MAMSNDRVHPRKRKKVCSFCVDKVTHIDFKDTVKLRRYLSERGACDETCRAPQYGRYGGHTAGNRLFDHAAHARNAARHAGP